MFIRAIFERDVSLGGAAAQHTHDALAQLDGGVQAPLRRIPDCESDPLFPVPFEGQVGQADGQVGAANTRFRRK